MSEVSSTCAPFHESQKSGLFVYRMLILRFILYLNQYYSVFGFTTVYTFTNSVFQCNIVIAKFISIILQFTSYCTACAYWHFETKVKNTLIFNQIIDLYSKTTCQSLLLADLWASFKHPPLHKQSETFHSVYSAMAKLRNILKVWGPDDPSKILKRDSWDSQNWQWDSAFQIAFNPDHLLWFGLIINLFYRFTARLSATDHIIGSNGANINLLNVNADFPLHKKNSSIHYFHYLRYRLLKIAHHFVSHIVFIAENSK